jgi:hypothetical protein
MLEELCKTHQHLIAAVGAFAPLAAVCVSLYLARRSETVRLRALLSIDLSPTDPSRLVILQIHNTSARPAALAPPPFFEWSIPFLRKRQRETMISSINSAYSIKRDKVTNQINFGCPMNIPVTDIDMFRTQFTRELQFIGQKLRRFPKTRLKRLGAVIYTNDDRRFPVTFAEAMADEIKSLVEEYLRKKKS